MTVTIKLHVGPTDEVQVTVVVPFGKNEADGGTQVIVPQFGFAGGVYDTVAPH